MTAVTSTGNVSFVSIHTSFNAILGPSPAVTWGIADPEGRPIFHEACVYNPATKSVFASSNKLPSPNGEGSVIITQIFDNDDPTAVSAQKVTPIDLVFANGGFNYKSGLVFCSQGNLANDPPSGVVYMPDPTSLLEIEYLVSSFQNRSFNSPNDLIVHPQDGSIWFTDPGYGFPQKFRPPPELPNQVYRLDPETQSIRAVADGFLRPNGLCLSHDLQLLYVTDTGAINGAADIPFDKTGPASIYAFDVLNTENGPFLTNRRLFAFADTGIPDGIKVDTHGNVYSGCGDGVNVWNSGGTLLGKILVKGGVANFSFGEKGALYMCNEQNLWKVQLSTEIRGAALGL